MPRSVAPGQTAVIEAEMDTRNFVGPKSTILYVTLITASGREGEVGLGVCVPYLERHRPEPRRDRFWDRRARPVADPGPDDRPDQRRGLAIRAHGLGCRAINAQLVETARNGDSASYALSVSLKPDAPAGPLRDEIRLISNDPETPEHPAHGDGLDSRRPDGRAVGLVAGPDPFGGRCARPFRRPRIAPLHDPVDRGGRRRVFDVAPRRDAPADARRDRRLQARRGNDRGDIRHVFRVHTDLPGEPPLDLTATLHVDP